MQTDLFSQPAPEPIRARKIDAEPEPLPHDPQTESPYYTMILDNGSRITYNKEIRT